MKYSLSTLLVVVLTISVVLFVNVLPAVEVYGIKGSADKIIQQKYGWPMTYLMTYHLEKEGDVIDNPMTIRKVGAIVDLLVMFVLIITAAAISEYVRLSRKNYTKREV